MPVLAGIVKDDARRAQGDRVRLPRPGRRVHLVGRRVGRGARRGQGGILPSRGHRPQGGDAAGHTSGLRPHRGSRAGLPGNPVSVFVSFRLFVRHAMPGPGPETARPAAGARHPHVRRQRPHGKMQYLRVVIQRSTEAGQPRRPAERLEPHLDRGAGERARDDPPRAPRPPRPGPRCGSWSFGPGKTEGRGGRQPRRADRRRRRRHPIVEVGGKPETERVATAECWVTTTPRPGISWPARRRATLSRPRRSPASSG